MRLASKGNAALRSLLAGAKELEEEGEDVDDVQVDVEGPEDVFLWAQRVPAIPHQHLGVKCQELCGKRRKLRDSHTGIWHREAKSALMSSPSCFTGPRTKTQPLFMGSNCNLKAPNNALRKLQLSPAFISLSSQALSLTITPCLLHPSQMCPRTSSGPILPVPPQPGPTIAIPRRPPVQKPLPSTGVTWTQRGTAEAAGPEQ